jgi:hypothetical protein
MELDAEVARAAFWRGEYNVATETFTALSADFNTSQPLYLCELASTHLAAGREDEAFATLQKAYGLLECFYDTHSEERAMSLWGAECEKVYKGDPYERSMLCLVLGLMFLERGDVDNALACFKNGQLCDSDVASDLYKCDFGMLQLLESRCYAFRDEPDQCEASLEKAGESFLLTYPSVRRLVGEKQETARRFAELSAAKRLSSRDREEKAALEEQIERAESDICECTGVIDMAYLDPLLDETSTLVLIWTGMGPYKRRLGQYGELAYMEVPFSARLRHEVCVDGTTWYDGMQGFCDVAFQATTRGGRIMDNVLAKQAAFKRETAELGNIFIREAQNQSDPAAAAALLIIGAISAGISEATHAEADIRCWQLLPDEFHLVALDLPPGLHDFHIHVYDQMLKVDEWRFAAEVQPSETLDVIWAIRAGEKPVQ